MRNIMLISFLLFAKFGFLQAQIDQCPAEDYFPKSFDPTIRLTPIPDRDPGDPSAPPSGIENFRTIYWVHGLGGSSDSWSEASTATDLGGIIPPSTVVNFPARKTASYTPTYTETSLDAAAKKLVDNIDILTPANKNDLTYDFIIAHSQGGIVSRYADYLTETVGFPTKDRRFYGVVTFDSPNGGAQIINSRDAGLISELASEACSAVLTGPVANLFSNAPILGFFVDPSGVYNTVSSLCSVAGGSVLPFLLKDLTAGSTNGFKVGAPELGAVNSYGNPTIHRAAIEGVEYSAASGETPANPKQLLWRTMYSFPNSSAGPEFSNNTDQAWVTAMNNLRVDYEVQYNFELNMVNQLKALGYPKNCFWACFPPSPSASYVLCLANCAYNNNLYDVHEANRVALAKAIDWMDDSDDQWKIIIGALDFVPNTNGYCTCVDENGVTTITENVNSKAECSLLGNNGGINEYPYCIWAPYQDVPVYKASDGIVTQESQAAWVTPSYRMDQTNHFQARNSRQTALALLSVFQGENGIDQWFITNVR